MMLSPTILLALLASCLANKESIIFNRLNQKIIGGTPAAIVQFPYVISLQFDLLGIIRRHICGGSIISPQWVVTAAHCTEEFGVSSLVIRSGSDWTASGGSVHDVSQIIEHPNYVVGVHPDNDIAVVRVRTHFTYSSTVQAVRLPAANAPVPSGTYGTTAGWGATSQGGIGSAILLQVSVPIISNAECTQRFYAASRITAGMLCAGYLAGGKDSCQGDSGGPLMVSGTLVGIVSWGDGCAQPYAPGVYVSVAHYRQWIAFNTGV